MVHPCRKNRGFATFGVCERIYVNKLQYRTKIILLLQWYGITSKEGIPDSYDKSDQA